MKYLFILLSLGGLMAIFSCKTKNMAPTSGQPFDPVLMEKMWKSIDSLEKKGLVSSALTEVRKIKQSALAGQSSGHLVKAILHENRYLTQLEEDSSIKALSRAEEEINSYPEPAKSVMHSLAAQWYSVYLQSHLWELRNRTEFVGTAGPDIRTWGIRHFVDRIHEHYRLSVQWDGLKAADVKAYELLLTEEQKTDDLRPTLYDILMHRALDFYSGNETYLTKPSYDYVLTDPLAFSPARSFIGHSFISTDSLSPTWIALQWFQQLLAFRLSDSNHETALLDADLKRLRFVHDQMTLDGKDSIYLAALEGLVKSYEHNPETALVAFYKAEILMQQGAQWQPGAGSSNRYKYKEAHEVCTKAIGQFPDAYGSQLCKTLIRQIEQKTLSGSVESVNLPNEKLLAELKYRNLSVVNLKLVKLPESPKRWRSDTWDGIEILRRLNQINSFSEWKQTLDNSSDFQTHSTEIALPGLTYGHYALVISDKDNFDPGVATTGTILFTISELGYWFLDDRKTDQRVAIIHRGTGLPIEGVKTEFISYIYNAMRRRQEEVKTGEGISDKNGWVTNRNQDNQSVFLRLTRGDDELVSEDMFHTYRQGGQTSNEPVTLFFSDRSIYRPGQKVFFKAYALEFDKNRIPAIVPNRNVDVVLYDANGQEVSKQTLKSNTYGTFAGHFDLPSGGMTGRMSLSSSHGSNRHFFQVEEYKRPKFEVTFDTLKETVRLDEEVIIRGRASDYAGSAVSGAEASYRVERVSYRPWWYGYWKGFWPSREDRQVLAVSQTVTHEDGSVDIVFQAKSKSGADPDLMYSFEITLFVTDVTGESHEAVKQIVLNRQGYEVDIALPDRSNIEKIKSIAVSARNSDGAMVRVNGEVEVSALQGPGGNKRNRLWTLPDILSIPEADYTRDFTHYFAPGKEPMSTWPVENVAGKKSVSVNGSGVADVSALITKPGYYKLRWTWTDNLGKKLEITQYCMIYEQGELLPGHEVVQIEFPDTNFAPGHGVKFDLHTGLSKPPQTIRIVDRRVDTTTIDWVYLANPNSKSIKLAENDRGGVYVHHLTAFNNRFFTDQQLIRVPWSNKELHLALKTWRDKLEPGDEETWTITVNGPGMDKVTSEMLLSMYDASLDAFLPHQWQMSLYPVTSSKTSIQNAQPVADHFWQLTYHWNDQIQDVPWRQYRDINLYGYYPDGGYYTRGRGGKRYKGEDGVIMMQALEVAPAAVPGEQGQEADMILKSDKPVTQKGDESVPQSPPPLRSALEETVFFYPQINTDEQGNLTFNFKMKEGLTRWKFQALAHSKELAFGLTQAEIVTQKQLMVFPNPPRFFREGDTIAFQIKVTNLTDQLLSGNAQLKMLDAFSNEDVSSAWKISPVQQPIQIPSKGSTAASWLLQVPDGWYRPVKYQVSASAGTYTDGEEALLPVVTNRILITETLPLPVKANETRTFIFQSMMQNRTSGSTDHQYVVELTTTPAWYAVQALPYLMEYPHECAEQIFSRVYANGLASHIANQYPAIRQVYDGWRLAGDDALVSNLEKNKDLKSAMLEETPWVRDAMGETQQKKDIALLFETNRIRYEMQQALLRLGQMQMANGGFPWFPGGHDNWYITQYIVEGFGHLRKMNVQLTGEGQSEILTRAIPYIDARMLEWYKELKHLESAGKIKMEEHQIGPMQIHYLYARSFFPEIQPPAEMSDVVLYLKSQCEKYWLQHGLYDQGMMALGSFRTWPNAALAKEILASLREKTIVHEELGRYWKINAGFAWNEAPVELQSLMIELFQDMGVSQAETDELRVWLLKQKQTTRWKTTKATASAIYALLIHPDTWLQSVGTVDVKLGGNEIIGSNTETQAGTGYVKKTFTGEAIKDDWTSITVSNPNNHITWGGVYWQYWEDMDKVKSTVDHNPLTINRSLLLSKSGDRGDQTNIAPSQKLKVGDKLVVRLTIETDRAMEFVHLKDLRASGFEPMDVLSGYKWGGGLGYYQSTKDLATHFFIDYLPRGKFVIEYPVTVAQAGSYSEGLATLQCMYAPEFGSHSSGARVKASLN